MKKAIKFGVPLILLLLNSCVYSLHPIYTRDTIVFEPTLLGTWQAPDGSFIEFVNTHWIDDHKLDLSINQDELVVWNGDTLRTKEEIEVLEAQLAASLSSEEKEEAILNTYSYEAMMGDADDSVRYSRHIAKIGDIHYLDLTVSDISSYDDLPYDVLIPVHTFYKLEMKGTSIVITPFDLPKLRDLFRANRVRLRHEEVDDDILITAQPEEIQKFLKVYGKDPSVYDNSQQFSLISPK